MRARLRTTGASIARSTVGKITATNSRNRRDAMLIALIEDCIRSDASANLCKTVTDSFHTQNRRGTEITKDLVRPARSTN
jgi:hypothetical protein